MKIIELDYQNITKIDDNICLCLGFFDGVHRGHQKLILEAKKHSKNKIGILTFSQPVSTFINNGKSTETLSSNTDKIRLISKLNIDYYFVLNIDKKFLEFSPLDFINQILKNLNIKEIYIGEDYRFGKDASGGKELLKKYFDVKVINILNIDSKKISSSNIIKLIKEGRIERANNLLGHNYEITGKVVEGHHLGTKIGFPTENIDLSHSYVLPKRGVYKTIIYISGIPYLSLTNVGVHPTVGKENKDVIEVYIPNYNSDDYGKTIYLTFLDFIRDEIKFNNVDELKTQISKDLDALKN